MFCIGKRETLNGAMIKNWGSMVFCCCDLRMSHKDNTNYNGEGGFEPLIVHNPTTILTARPRHRPTHHWFQFLICKQTEKSTPYYDTKSLKVKKRTC